MNQRQRQNREARRRDRSWQGRRAPQATPAKSGGRWPGAGLNFGLIAVVAIALALVAIIGWSILNRARSADSRDPASDQSASLPGQYFPNLGQAHLQPDEIYDRYNSNPPTSGPHDPVPAPWGVNTVAISNEKLVHNLEHGGGAILYNCPDGCPDITTPLTAYVKDKAGQGHNVLLAPYPGMDHKIAIAAWTRLDAFDAIDMERVKRFVDTHLCRFDPEHVCR